MKNIQNLKIKPKILFFLSYPKSGGTELIVLNILQRYQKLFDICFLFESDSLSIKFAQYSNQIFFLNYSKSKFNALKNFLKIVKKNSYDAILSFGLKPNLLARIIKIFFPQIKIINNLRSVFSGDSKNYFHTILDFITQFLFDEYWVNSKAGINYLIKNGFEANKIKLFYNGIDLAKINEIEKCVIPDTENKIVVVNVGNLRKVKNQSFIIKIAKKLKEKNFDKVKFIIIGDGELRQNLENEIIKNNLQDYVLLSGKKDNVVSYLKSSDIFLFTSLYEGLPNAIIEAAAIGLPVISYNAGGTGEIISNQKGGYIINEFNPDLFAEKIIELANSPEKRKLMGEYNKKFISENFNIEIMYNRFEELLHYALYPKKIVRIIARLNVGGPAKHTVYLTKLLNNQFFKTTLITGYVEENEKSMEYFAKENNVKPKFIKYLHRSLSFKDDILAITYLFFYLLKKQPDIVHTHTAKAGTVGRVAAGIINIINFLLFKKRIKIFHTFHGHTFHSYHSPMQTKFFIFIEKFLTRFFTDKMIVLSKQQFDEIVWKYKIGKPEKFTIIPLGFDFSEIEINEKNKIIFRDKYKIDYNDIVVGIIGRLTGVKNHFRFLRIVQLYIEKYKKENVKFCIIGEGELFNELNEFVKKNNLEKYVIFTGTIESLSIIYSAIDIVALTSDNEGTPLTIIEAFYSKRPVISTNVGGVNDLLLNDRGICIEKENEEKFADMLNELIENNELKNRYIENAYNYVVKTHSLEALVNNIVNLYING